VVGTVVVAGLVVVGLAVVGLAVVGLAVVGITSTIGCVVLDVVVVAPGTVVVVVLSG
jgi:hypothetical protein